MMSPNDPIKLWERCLVKIKAATSEEDFNTWFQPIQPLSYKEHTLTVQLPSAFFYEWLETHYLELLHQVIPGVLGDQGKLAYYIPPKKVDRRAKQAPAAPLAQKKKHLPEADRLLYTQPTPLHPDYLFKHFIEGSTNKLTKAVAERVAHAPGKTPFNPFVIFGGLGRGKTHLSQAIAHEARALHGPDFRIHYISPETLVNQFVASIKQRKTDQFFEFYFELDLLILEDIQLLAKKEKTQETFFRIFNHLHQARKQLVITSDTPPSELEGLQKRLISRFKWGLVTELQQPDEATWEQIIRYKLKQKQLVLTDQQVQRLVEQMVHRSVRELEGVVHALVAYQELTKTKITTDLFEKILKRVGQQQTPALDMTYIWKQVAGFFKIKDPELLKGKSRKREVVLARQVSMYLIKDCTNYSLKSIGDYFGGKDHTTVIYAQRNVNNLLQTDPHFRSRFMKLKRMLMSQTPLVE